MTPEPCERTVFDTNKDFSLFPVKYTDEDGSNDLVGCLASQIFPKFPKQGTLNADSGERVVTQAADVIAFAPVRDESLPSYQDAATGKSQQRRKFSFPDSFHLDRFSMTNHERAREIIQNANVAEEEIRRLKKKKTEFTKLDVSDIWFSLTIEKLTGAVEQGCYEERPILPILLRERGTLFDRSRTTSSH